MNKKVEEDSKIEKAGCSVSPRTKTKSSDMVGLTKSNFKSKSKRMSGRLGKRKSRKTVRIKNLDAIDFLHNETLLSTTSDGNEKKLPPPPGCVDYQFTTLSALAAETVPIHSELPPATSETPYALQILLDLYREQFLSMLRYMRSDEYKKNVESQIIDQKARKRELTGKLEQLEKQINLLIGDSLKLLRTRMTEIGISNGYSAKDLMVKAKEIMLKHHELQGEASDLTHEIPTLEGENTQLQKEKDEDAIMLSEMIPVIKLEKIDLQETNEVEHLRKDESCINVSDIKSESVSEECDLPVDVQNIKREKDVSSIITPCSVALPRITCDDPIEGTKIKLLTPAQKKFAHVEPPLESCNRNLHSDIPALNNENKPPSERHSNGHRHHHKSSKRSRKCKKKHKHQYLSPEKATHHEQTDTHASALKFDNTPVVKSLKTEPSASPSYSKVSSNVFKDSIEDIITRTLNNDFKAPSVSVNLEPCTASNSLYSTNGSSNRKSDQSDYRRVPPMKIALKKFVQENKTSQVPSTNLIGTTVGDLVSSEIEKSLEISNRNYINSSSVSFDSIINRSTSKFHHMGNGERKETSERFHSKSSFLAPARLITSPYSSKYSPSYSMPSTRKKEEPLEGLAASMFGAVNSRSEENSSRHASPFYTSATNLEFKMSEPNLTSEYSDSSSIHMLPNEANNSSEDQNDASGNKWQEVSRGFDRMFEFVSTKLDSQENVPCKIKSKNRGKESNDKHSPTFNLNPPSLFRADSSSLDSPPMPDLPVSPASLEGPFSPVPSLSPPSLSSPVSNLAFNQNSESREEHINFNEKFRPKGKGWKWH